MVQTHTFQLKWFGNVSQGGSFPLQRRPPFLFIFAVFVMTKDLLGCLAPRLSQATHSQGGKSVQASLSSSQCPPQPTGMPAASIHIILKELR